MNRRLILHHCPCSFKSFLIFNFWTSKDEITITLILVIYNNRLFPIRMVFLRSIKSQTPFNLRILINPTPYILIDLCYRRNTWIFTHNSIILASNFNFYLFLKCFLFLKWFLFFTGCFIFRFPDEDLILFLIVEGSLSVFLIFCLRRNV